MGVCNSAIDPDAAEELSGYSADGIAPEYLDLAERCKKTFTRQFHALAQLAPSNLNLVDTHEVVPIIIAFHHNDKDHHHALATTILPLIHDRYTTSNSLHLELFLKICMELALSNLDPPEIEAGLAKVEAMGLPSHPVTGKSIMSMIPSERHLLRLFRVLDLDHSNILEADELRAIGKALRDPKCKMVDQNQDHVIDFGEFQGFFHNQIETLFKLLDEDKSGSLSSTELKAVAKKTLNFFVEEEHEAFLRDSLDKDGDGRVSLEEFKDYTLGFAFNGLYGTELLQGMEAVVKLVETQAAEVKTK